MSRKWQSSCLLAVQTSCIHTPRHGFIPLSSIYQQTHRRRYAHQPPQQARPDAATSIAISEHYSAKAALNAIQSRTHGDPINPPRSTLPPPLELPERDKAPSVFIYWFRIGRAYGSFYKEGVKAVWFNNRAAKLLRERVSGELGAGGEKEAAARGLISRSEWQVLRRNEHDIGKLPLFGVLVVVFGEWLPLFVPFMPGVVPGTCRIPSQVRGMHEVGEERRRMSFRTANFEPEKGQIGFGEMAAVEGGAWPMASEEYILDVLKPMRDDQLHHLSTTLGLHGRIWDRLQLSPFLIRRRVTRHLQYLALDDRLLAQAPPSSKLSQVELENACSERGLDVLGRPEAILRESLEWWVKRQEEDEGRGRAMLSMLFRRLAIRDWVGLHVKANDRAQT
ncbi:hypothetical protein LTR12_017277 [Friedmanniomyces endolithicus]|nr:hypothetical protein LTR12_017277 [Friedmanniomyces endolithicus]